MRAHSVTLILIIACLRVCNANICQPVMHACLVKCGSYRYLKLSKAFLSTDKVLKSRQVFRYIVGADHFLGFKSLNFNIFWEGGSEK